MEWILQKPLQSLQEVKRFEEKYEVKFPKSFNDVVIAYNAGRPRPNVFDTTTKKEIVAKALLSFDAHHLENIWETTSNLQKRLPANIIPFMSDQFGNYICFEFDPLEDEPLVVFWHHELGLDQVQQVAPTFRQFLANFYGI
ncbi:SMI1/KNR4 family protein [Psychrobacillus sp. PGGUH221]|uniref:SMI1/KNR4 family protein n=1 Tax=Psychrobacillus sp. PGGUH221 TaxID=3020058 RepID=UPI0035C6C7C9